MSETRPTIKEMLVGNNTVTSENCKPGTKLEVRYVPYMGEEIRLQFASFYDEQGGQKFGTTVFGDGTGSDRLPVVLKSGVQDRISKAKDAKDDAIEKDKASLNQSSQRDYNRQLAGSKRSSAFHDGGGQTPNVVRVRNTDNEWLTPSIIPGEKTIFTVIQTPKGTFKGYGQTGDVAVKYVNGPISIQQGSERKYSDINSLQIGDIDSINGQKPGDFITNSYFIIKKKDLDYFRKKGLIK